MPSSLSTGQWLSMIGGFMLCLLLAIFPLPAWASLWRPEWLCLALIFWVLRAPHNMGIAAAWGLGLLQDFLEGGVWGAHALGLSLVAYVCGVAHLRMRIYSVWHQTFWVFVLVGLHQVSSGWVIGLAGYDADPLYVLSSALASALTWPIAVFIDRYRPRVSVPVA